MSSLQQRFSHASLYLTVSLPLVQGGWLVIAGLVNYAMARFDSSLGTAHVGLLQCFLYAFDLRDPARYFWYWWPSPLALYMFAKEFVTWKSPDPPQKPSLTDNQLFSMGSAPEALRSLQWNPVSSNGLQHVPYGFTVVCTYGLLRISKKGQLSREIVWTPQGPYPIVRTNTLTIHEPALDQYEGVGWMVWLKKGTTYMPIAIGNAEIKRWQLFTRDQSILRTLDAGTTDYVAQCISLIITDLAQNMVLLKLEDLLGVSQRGDGNHDGLLP